MTASVPTTPAAASGRRGLPRLLPHLVWEAVLLLGVVVVTVVAVLRVDLFTGPGLWWLVAVVGLLATGLALSLRTATPNLAVTGVLALSGASYAWLVTDVEAPKALAAVAALLIAMVVGVVLGAVAGLTSAPGWAVSLGGLGLTYAVAVALLGSAGRPMRAEPLLGSSGGWVAAFLLVSLAGGGCWAAFPGLRRWLGADPPTEHPARFRVERLVGALIGFTGSSLLAGLAGLAMVSQLQAAQPTLRVELLLVAGAAVLLGGVSAAGGRGGIAGTVLGTLLLAVFLHWMNLEDLRSISASVPMDLVVRFAVPGVLILVGLAVGRALAALSPADRQS